MEKTFFQIAENMPSENELLLRVMAVAHAALQLVYAVFAVIPTCLAAAVTVLIHPSHTGLWSRERSIWAQVALAAAAAAVTVFMPVATSVQIGFNLDGLDMRRLLTGLSMLAPCFLFSLTLPRLPDLVLSHVNLPSKSEEEAARAVLEEGDIRGYRWRLLLPFALLKNKRDDLLHFDQLLDTSSDEFYGIVGKCCEIADVPDSIDTENLLDRV